MQSEFGFFDFAAESGGSDFVKQLIDDIYCLFRFPIEKSIWLLCMAVSVVINNTLKENNNSYTLSPSRTDTDDEAQQQSQKSLCTNYTQSSEGYPQF